MNRRNGIHLTQDERMLINMYMRQYNEVSSQIEHLHVRLDQIRESINQIHQMHQRNEHEGEQHASRSSRNNFRNRYTTNLVPRFYNYYDYYGNRMRNLNPVFYDYNNPINPSLYTIDNDGFALRNLVNRLFGDENIAPTRAQIQNATRDTVYANIENPISDVCPISLNRFQANDVVTQIHHCGHIFSKDEATMWFSRSSLCPVCRYDIRSYGGSSQTQQRQPTSTPQNQNVQIAPDLNDYSDTETEEDETKTGDDYSNLNVRRDASNNVSEISFDISNNSLANSLFSNLTQNLLQSVLYGEFSQPSNNIYNYRLGNQDFVYDASNNVLMYETIIRPSRMW